MVQARILKDLNECFGIIENSTRVNKVNKMKLGGDGHAGI